MSFCVYTAPHAKNLPTKEAEARKDAWFPRSACDILGPPYLGPPPPEGACEACGVMSARPLHSGRVIRGHYFAVRRTKTSSERNVCSISKKELPRAVDRNREKRRCRALLRQISPEGTLHVEIKRAAKDAPFAALREELVRLARA